jgi:hypothetical protein
METIDAKRVTAAQFTESDKRSLMNKFIRNKEIMFLIFGLMFPYKTLLTTKKEIDDKLDGQQKLAHIPEEI